MKNVHVFTDLQQLFFSLLCLIQLVKCVNSEIQIKTSIIFTRVTSQWCKIIKQSALLLFNKLLVNTHINTKQ